MQITFGKHSGKSLELLLLKEPDYVCWILEQAGAYGQMKAAQAQAEKLIRKFNAKSVVKSCSGRNCENLATRCTVYSKNVQSPYWWCDDCDPYQAGANRGKIQPISSYQDAVQHVGLYCSARKADLKDLIKSLARAKGLPSRVGEVQAQAFFA